jgi:bifunctional non-homologous end joining protein LigD
VRTKVIAPPSKSKKAAMPKKRTPEVTLSHPDKVLYPDSGITKQDLANYYLAIKDLILPYLRRRPLTVLRCPAGKDASCFFQKHPDRSLTELPEVDIKENSSKRKVPYFYVEDTKDILELVQSNVLELHIWGSSVDDLERPNQIVFDLDPDTQVAFKQLKEAAFVVRDMLKRIGLESFLKTTGGKGLHVVVPITPEGDWDDVKEFARDVAVTFEKQSPEMFTANMSKKKRTGRIFLDYLRNGRGATAIAPYSTRAKAGATVSIPLSWDDLKLARTLPTYTVLTAPKYLLARKKDPWAKFLSTKQSLPVI